MSRFTELYKKYEKRETDLHLLQKEEGFSRFILVRSFSTYHLKKALKRIDPKVDTGVATSKLYPLLFDAAVTLEWLIKFVKSEYPAVRQERKEQELHLPSIIDDFESVKCGVRNDNLNDTAKDLVRDKSIETMMQLEERIDDLLSTRIKGYIFWQYYNQVTNDLIEHIFNDHPNVIPTLRKIKYVDFMVQVGDEIIPFDLKITHISDGYYDLCQKGLIRSEVGQDDYQIADGLSESELIKNEYKKLKKVRALPNFGGMTKQEMIEVLESVGERTLVGEFKRNRKNLVDRLSDNLKSVEWWNYKWQGERLFKNNNRFFVFLAYQALFEDARPLKGNIALIKEKVEAKLNTISNGDLNTVRYYYQKDKGLEGEYIVQSTSVLVTD
jgi:hypothetical protein